MTTRARASKTAVPKVVPFQRFAAIDFETADYGRDSACSVAVVVAEGGAIVQQVHRLIRPPRRTFLFSYLHGITWEHVARQPTFGEVWRELEPLLQGVEFIAAHNASFDRGVVHACCAAHGHPAPETRYICTMKLARNLWDLRPTKLSDVCRHFGIPLKHHDAESDAVACARIVLRATEHGIPIRAFLPAMPVPPKGA